MGLISVVLEFDVVTEGKASTHRIIKRIREGTRADIETQVSEIIKSVWDGASEEDIAMIISKAKYKPAVMADETDIDEIVKEYLRNQQNK